LQMSQVKTVPKMLSNVSSQSIVVILLAKLADTPIKTDRVSLPAFI